MRGLGPRIHEFFWTAGGKKKVVDGRNKSGHDDDGESAST
jgi:hypothetical protein